MPRVYPVADMSRDTLKILLLGLGGLLFTWFFWLPGNPLLGNACSSVFAASDLMRQAGNYHAKSIAAPGLLFYLVQGGLGGILSPMIAIRLILTAYVFSMVFGAWYVLKVYDRPEASILLVFPLIFNAALCKGDLSLVLAIGLFPWLMWGIQAFMRKTDLKHGIILILLNLAMFYADFVVFGGVVMLQAILVAQYKDRQRASHWGQVIAISLIPMLIWASQGGMSPWLKGLRHSERNFLSAWYFMLGNCFRGYWDEWTLVAGGFAVFTAIIGQNKQNKQSIAIFALLAVVLLVPSGISNGLTMSARLVIPAFLFLGLFAADKDMKMKRMFTILATIAAALAMISANHGMTRWMYETHAYDVMKQAVRPNNVINETCFGKFSKSVNYPGWHNWNQCIAADTRCLPARVQAPSRFDPLSHIPYFNAHSNYTIVCKKKKSFASYTRPYNMTENRKSGPWMLFMWQERPAPAKAKPAKIKKLLHPIKKIGMPMLRRLPKRLLLPNIRIKPPKRKIK